MTSDGQFVVFKEHKPFYEVYTFQKQKNMQKILSLSCLMFYYNFMFFITFLCLLLQIICEESEVP